MCYFFGGGCFGGFKIQFEAGLTFDPLVIRTALLRVEAFFHEISWSWVFQTISRLQQNISKHRIAPIFFGYWGVKDVQKDPIAESIKPHIPCGGDSSKFERPTITLFCSECSVFVVFAMEFKAQPVLVNLGCVGELTLPLIFIPCPKTKSHSLPPIQAWWSNPNHSRIVPEFSRVNLKKTCFLIEFQVSFVFLWNSHLSSFFLCTSSYLFLLMKSPFLLNHIESTWRTPHSRNFTPCFWVSLSCRWPIRRSLQDPMRVQFFLSLLAVSLAWMLGRSEKVGIHGYLLLRSLGISRGKTWG